MALDEMAALCTRYQPFASDGRFELFKTATKYDGNEGRKQHHYLAVEELSV